MHAIYIDVRYHVVSGQVFLQLLFDHLSGMVT